jgi:flagellar hook protein FlgE
MSLLSALMASVSGMQAQANALSTISDNIANADTTGYKEASTQFEDMLSSVSANDYNAGGVSTVVRYGISAQGSLASTTSATDLAIQGNGFFVVQNASGANLLTRAGSFTQNSNGTLVNAAGFTLMGEPIAAGSTTTAAISGVDQLVPVTISPVALVANPTTTGTLVANLDSNSTAVTTAADLPSANASTSTYTSETSLTTYDNLGNSVTLNTYFTKTGADTWEVDVYNAADAATGGGFPYTSGALTTATLNFDATTGALASSTVAVPTTSTAASGTIPVDIPNGQTLNLDVSSMTQLASTFAISNNTVNGNAPATFENVSIATDGTLSEVYSNGTTVPVYKIPLATVASVDSLTPLAGDVYQANAESGSVVVGGANTGGFGSINSDELESSTVDLATELTNMVVAQNAYSANSKAFQVGSDLLQELSNLIK